MSEYEIIIGDCIEALQSLDEKSVHTMVTSPPYFGLRDYQTGTWEGGDNPECDHAIPEGEIDPKQGGGEAGSSKTVKFNKTSCHKCGAKRVDKQGGLEEELDCLSWARKEKPCDKCYICWVRKVAAECHRVLRDDGTLWWNVGDSYNGSGGAGGDYAPDGLKAGQPKYGKKNLRRLKPKDMCMTPARTALALQADGWYLRQDIIWAKPNCMPEAVKDRCTKNHEYIFLLTKSRYYYFDNVAISEKTNTPAGATWQERKAAGATAGNIGVSPTYQRGVHGDGSAGSNLTRGDGLRNKRSVWWVGPKPFKGAHFAVYPTELIEPCILAGTSAVGCCSECGAPHERVIEKTEGEITQSMKNAGAGKDGSYDGKDLKDYDTNWIGSQKPADIKKRTLESMKKVTTTIGWNASCECNAGIVPCTVLDPFLGSGTTIEVALKHGRNAIGIELSEEYAALARKRLANVDKALGISDDREWV